MKKKILSVLLVLAIFAIPAFSEVDIYGYGGPAVVFGHYNETAYCSALAGVGVNYEMNLEKLNWTVGGKVEVLSGITMYSFLLTGGIGKNFSVSENSLIDVQFLVDYNLLPVGYYLAGQSSLQMFCFEAKAQWEQKTRSLPAVGIGIRMSNYLLPEVTTYSYACSLDIPVYVTWTIKTKSDKALYE